MIAIVADPKDLELVLAKLAGAKKQAPKAVRSAVNDTAASARKLLAQHAQKRYTVKDAGFNRHTKVKKATLSKLEASVSIQGSPLTQPRFHTVASKSGVRTEVLRGEGLTLLENNAGNKAFKAKVATGKKNTDGTATKEDKTTNMILQRRGKKRYPMRSFHGPSVSKMVEMVYRGGKITDEGMREEILRIYQENLRKQIERMVNA